MNALIIFILGFVTAIAGLMVLPIIGMMPPVVLQIGNQRFIAKFMNFDWDKRI